MTYGVVRGLVQDDALETHRRTGVASVAAVATRRDDVCESFEIEFDDGLERLGGCSAGEGFGQGFEPSGVFRLQGEQFGDGIKPALGSGSFVLGPALTDDWQELISLAPSAVAGLSLGVGEGLLALWLTPSGHGASPSRNGIELIGRGGMCVGGGGFGRPAAAARDRCDGTGVGGMASGGQQVDVFAQSIARPFDLDHHGMVEQPVEQRGSYDGVTEHLAPFCEATV